MHSGLETRYNYTWLAIHFEKYTLYQSKMKTINYFSVITRTCRMCRSTCQASDNSPVILCKLVLRTDATPFIYCIISKAIRQTYYSRLRVEQICSLIVIVKFHKRHNTEMHCGGNVISYDTDYAIVYVMRLVSYGMLPINIVFAAIAVK